MENKRRLIYVDKAIEKINCLCVDSNESWIGSDNQSFVDHADVIDILSDIPAVDAVEVVHAKWIKTEVGSNCSACGLNVMSWSGNYDGYEREKGICLMRYCPNCGAKMDLED